MLQTLNWDIRNASAGLRVAQVGLVISLLLASVAVSI